jgi:fumarate hydratase subunit beta
LSKCIKKQSIIAYDDLGTEALREIYVEKFPAIVIINCNGNSIYERQGGK